MENLRRSSTVVFGTLLAAGCLSSVRAAEEPVDRGLVAAVVIESWPAVSAAAARAVIARYGVPDEVAPDRLAWIENRPWRRTVVRRMAPLDADAEDRGVIEQAVDYRLTPRQASALKAFDPRLVYDRGARELGSRSEREAVNFLRLNLANDIVSGRMTPDQARALYAQVLRLEGAGKSSSYLQVLYFSR